MSLLQVAAAGPGPASSFPVVTSSSHHNLQSLHVVQPTQMHALTPPAASRPSTSISSSQHPPPLAASSSHNSLHSLYSTSHSRQPSSSDLHHSSHPNATSPLSLQKMNTIHHLQHYEADVHYPCTADDYDILQEIGVGAFATVYRATVNASGEEVAIKIIDLEQFNVNWDEIRREIQIMSLLHHPNVVKIKSSFIVNSDLWIVMPLLQAGSCAALMKQLAPTGFKDEALIATILKETLQGLMYFHKDGRIHRDLKAGNILIGSGGEVQLADFGVAGTLMENGDRKKNRQTFTGTPCWMAPEVMEHTSGYDEKADIWSFGITAMELGFGRAPYAKFQPMKVMLLTISEEPPTTDIYKDNAYVFSKAYQSLIGKCLRKDPKRRPTAKKLMDHKFFKLARDRHYLVERLVSRLPPRSAPIDRIHVCREKTLVDQAKVEKSKPVSVGSWSFDKEELVNIKQRAAEEKAGQRQSRSAREREEAVENSYHHHSDSDGGEGDAAHHQPVQQDMYAQPIAPAELPLQGVPGQHRANIDVNQELLVKQGADDGHQRAPIPTFSPVVRQQSKQHQEGRFMVTDDQEDSHSRRSAASKSGGGAAGAAGEDGGLHSFDGDGQHVQHVHVNGHDVKIVEDERSPQFHQGGAQEEELEEQVGRFSIRDE